MAKSPILAVILNWKGSEYTIRCAEHVLAQVGVPVDILIVDNGSDDDIEDRVQRSSLPVRLHMLDTNQGFAGGMNAGLHEALTNSYRYVWLLNNDAFPEADCLQRLVERMEGDRSLAMVTPRLLSPDGSEQHAGGAVDWNNGDLGAMKSSELVVAAGDHYWLTGTAPLLRVAALTTTGLFEPQFFAYWEDVDLCVRLRRAGGQLAAVPEAIVVHIGSASAGQNSPFANFLYTRNAWLFLERNAHMGSARVRWLRFVSNTTRRAATVEMWGQPAVARAMLAGLSAARRRRYGRPASTIEPAIFERLTFKRPWRWSQILADVADVLEPIRFEVTDPGGNRWKRKY
jgi:GT2 family glycosyltransferase